MNNASALALIVGPTYVVLGLSVLFYAGAWQRLLEKYEKDHFLLFPQALFAMVAGLFVINMYNVWAWNLWVLITVTGWALFIKGVFYFLAPGKWITAVLKLRAGGLLYFGGMVVLLMGFFLSFAVYMQ
jgi:hypothetical protein